MRASSVKAADLPEAHAGTRQRRLLFSAWAGAVVLLAATLATYYPALRGEFVWDDPGWTTDLRPLFTDVDGLWRIWTTPKSIQQYYPLTGTTFWLDYHLWGGWTLPYHLENVVFHFAAAMLFWRL